MAQARAVAVMPSGSHALRLLCQKSRQLPCEAGRLVRAFLRIRLGRQHCPAWIDLLLWWHLPIVEGVPERVNGQAPRGVFVTTTTRTVDAAIFPKDEEWHRADGDKTLVSVHVEVYESTLGSIFYSWRLTCQKGELTRMRTRGHAGAVSFAEVLDEIRRNFDRRSGRPEVTMDTPLRVYRTGTASWTSGCSDELLLPNS